MKRLSLVLILSAAAATGQNNGFIPVTDQMLENPDPGDWLMWRRTLNGWGYSPLKEIDSRTVTRQSTATKSTRVWTTSFTAQSVI